jgi:iron(III) transport system permease protein
MVLVVFPVGCFLVLAFSPRLFGQPGGWFSLGAWRDIGADGFSGALINSLWVSATVAVGSSLLGGAMAWLVRRTDMPGRRLVSGLAWVVLLMPTYMIADGLEYLVEPKGVLYRLGIPSGWLFHLLLSPVGIVLVLVLAGTPFCFLTISAGLAAVGSDLEDAALVHGAGRLDLIKLLIGLVTPAISGALAIGFAEAMSDFGVAYTLGFQSHFQLATFSLYQAIDSFPSNFPAASAVSWLLIASAAIPIALQARAQRGRSYGLNLGRQRPATRRQLSAPAKIAWLFLPLGFGTLALAIPLLSAAASSLLTNLGGFGATGAHLTLSNYRALLSGDSRALGGAGALSALALSTRLALASAVVVTLLALAVAMAVRPGRSGPGARLADLILLGSVALPGVVLGAGYIFAFNLPIMSTLGINLYGTLPLLGMAYVAGALPSHARLMAGPVAQVKARLAEAARVHGAGPVETALKIVGPILARILLWVFLASFSRIMLELPVSELLYPAGHEPVAVAINRLLSLYNYGQGTALTVFAIGLAFGVIMAGLGLFRILAPHGWRRLTTTAEKTGHGA